MNKLTIVIVNWNTEDVLLKCLASIIKYPIKVSHRVYVVDNNSSDNSVNIIKNKYPWVKLIMNTQNVGFARANNQVLKKVLSNYYLILNPDIILQSQSVNKLIDFLDTNQGSCAVAPLLLNADGSIQKNGYFRKFPTLRQAYYFYTSKYSESIKNKKIVEKYWESKVDLCNAVEVEQIPGACMLIRHNALKRVCFFNEIYPLWFEDVDLCYKLRKNGGKLILLPSSRVIHKGGESFNKWTDDIKKQSRFYKSLFIFYDENENLIKRILIRVIIILDLLYIVLIQAMKQCLLPRVERKKYLESKWGILKCLLV